MQADPSLRANQFLMKRALDEVQKQAAILQSQGAANGLPGAAAAASEKTGSAVTLKRGAHGKLIPSYGGESRTPIDPPPDSPPHAAPAPAQNPYFRGQHPRATLPTMTGAPYFPPYFAPPPTSDAHPLASYYANPWGM